MSDVQVRQPDIIQQVKASQSGLRDALAERIGVERFTRAAVTALRTTPALMRCTPESVLGGLFVAAQLGLEVGGPRAYAHLVPYGRDAQLIVGYKGYVELFYRAGAKSVTANIVREGDRLERRTDENGRLSILWEDADPFDSERAPVGALAVITMASGEVLPHFMTKAQILKHKPRTAKAGPWSDWEEQMWLKTVLRDAARTARLSSDDLALAVQADQSITTGTGDSAKRRHVPVGESDFEPVTVAELTGEAAPLDPAHPDYVAPEVER